MPAFSSRNTGGWHRDDAAGDVDGGGAKPRTDDYTYSSGIGRSDDPNTWYAGEARAKQKSDTPTPAGVEEETTQIGGSSHLQQIAKFASKTAGITIKAPSSSSYTQASSSGGGYASSSQSQPLDSTAKGTASSRSQYDYGYPAPTGADTSYTGSDNSKNLFPCFPESTPTPSTRGQSNDPYSDYKYDNPNVYDNKYGYDSYEAGGSQKSTDRFQSHDQYPTRGAGDNKGGFDSYSAGSYQEPEVDPLARYRRPGYDSAPTGQGDKPTDPKSSASDYSKGGTYQYGDKELDSSDPYTSKSADNTASSWSRDAGYPGYGAKSGSAEVTATQLGDAGFGSRGSKSGSLGKEQDSAVASESDYARYGYGAEDRGGYEMGVDNSKGGYGRDSSGYGSGYGTGSGGYGTGNTESSDRYGTGSGGYGTGSGGYGTGSGGYGKESGGYGKESSGYGTGGGGYGKESSGYGTGSGVYGKESGYGTGSGGYGKESSGYGTGSGGYGKESSGYGTGSSWSQSGYGAESTDSGSKYGTESTPSKPIQYEAEIIDPYYAYQDYDTAWQDTGTDTQYSSYYGQSGANPDVDGVPLTDASGNDPSKDGAVADKKDPNAGAAKRVPPGPPPGPPPATAQRR